MHTISLELAAQVTEDMRETLVKNLYWCDQGITDVDLSGENPPVLTVTCSGDRDMGGIEVQVLADVAQMLSGPAQVRPRLIYETRNDSPMLSADQTFRELTARGWVSPELAGAFVYTGLMADLYYGLDRTFSDLASELGAHQVHLPSLLASETLLRAGHLRAHPHMANYVFHIHEDRSTVARFAERCSSDPRQIDLSGLATSAAHPEAILSPAACQPVYHMLSGRELDDPFIASGYVRCFRYESGATRGLRRSREFGVREIVYVGSEADVATFRQELLEVCRRLLDRFGLQGTLVTASDPFFTDASAQYRTFQLSLELKHELQLAIGADDTVAASSVNLHGDHFGRAWDIHVNDGEIAHSCCMGFGIDRWCLAIFSQFGLDARDWPHSLREVISA
jgi:seryl-tRNA synthetase